MVADSQATPPPPGPTRSSAVSVSTTAAGPGLLDAAVRRDRLLVAAALVLLAVLAWLYIVHLSRSMSPHSLMGMPMPEMGAPALGYLVPMWVVMMVAMMVPS